MQWFQDRAEKILAHNFHRWYGLATAALLIAVFSLYFYSLIPSGKIRFLWYAMGVVVGEILLCFVWAMHKFRYPKKSKDKLGIIIAIHTETYQDKKFLHKDFVSSFKEKISDLKLPFDVLVLKNHQAEKIETVEEAEAILRNRKSHFIVWGSVKRRPHQSKECFFFSLRAMVVHSPIQEVQKTILVNDFNALLPNKLIFEQGLQLEAFELRANQLVSAVDYITGRAALLSGDVKTALQLHESLYNAIQHGYQSLVSQKALSKVISIEYSLLADIVFFNAKQQISEEFIRLNQNALKYWGENYSSLLKKAIIEFNNGTGNPGEALKIIQKAQKHSAGKEWLYSKIFLHLWMKQYKKALTECERVIRKNTIISEKTTLDVCSFNKEILVRYPNKVELNFWLGFLYYKKLDNPSEADVYLQKFIDGSGTSMELLIQKAKEYQTEIKNKIGY